MLPVQTVMIWYMVLVYRWGAGWLGAAGGRGGTLGGDVTGGCARGGVLAEAHLARAREGPADEGPAGPFRGEYYSAWSSSSPSDSSSGFAGSLVSPELGLNSTVPTGIQHFTPSSSASPRGMG